MLSTYANYQLITRDIGRSIDRVKAQPMVQRETDYYLANIGKVTSIEEFVDDYRLFNYAMKAFGLSDMSYAKAFMVKAMEGGVKEEDSFANRLTDKRYAEFVRAFNFSADGARTTSFTQARDGTTGLFLQRAAIAGTDPEVMQRETAYFIENIVNVTSADDLLGDERLFAYAMWAYNVEVYADDKELIRAVLEGGIEDPDSPANTAGDKKLAVLASAFNFARWGEDATTYNPTQQNVVDKYLRQTLEENAGQQNEGVRLALYFKRKASSITSAFSILADKALAQVVRTALGLPESLAMADVDKQAALLAERLDVADFQDPQKLDKFLSRFTSMWEISNPSNPRLTAASILMSQPVEFGISTDALMALAQLKR